MRKKSRTIIAFVFTAAVVAVVAFAYYADVVATHTVTLNGISGYSTIEANTNSGLTELYTQAAILDDDYNEYGCGNNTVSNPTVSTIRATATAPDRSLRTGSNYYVQAYGHIKYMTKYGEEKLYYTDEDYFTYYDHLKSGSGDVMEVVDSYRDDRGVDYNETRANYIFEEFGMNPEHYTYACNYELMGYIETDKYLAIRTAMDIQAGTTTPSFFIDDDTIYGVCQNAAAVNLLYEFFKEADGNWTLCNTRQLQDVGRYQDVYQSFSNFQKTSVSAASSTEEIGGNYNEARANYIFEKFGMESEQYAYACNYELMDHVETDEYLAIRMAMDIRAGTTTPSFFVGNDIIYGVCQDATAVNCLYEFFKTADGTWSLRDTKQLQDDGRYQEICQSFSEYQVTVHAAISDIE